MFVEDNAKFSIQNFMKEKGDDDIQVSSWVAWTDSNGTEPMEIRKSRVIEYTHPVNAPMAPPMARARKEETYRMLPNYGFVLETRTFVSDVPMTDCFYVADFLVVEPVPNHTSVKVNMQFDIRFTKSTVFKGIISRTTRQEFQLFMQGLATFMSSNLGQGVEVDTLSR